MTDSQRKTLFNLMGWAMVSHASNGTNVQFRADDGDKWKFAGIITPDGNITSCRNI